MNSLILILGLILFVFSTLFTRQIIKDKKEGTDNGMNPVGGLIPLIVLAIFLIIISLCRIFGVSK